jgi:tetratricopeptide (TPR) repeat protein
MLAGGLDATALDRAVEAADRLPRIEDCADLAWLRAVGATAADEATRARIEELHERLAAARNRQIAGRYQEAVEAARAVAEESAAIHHSPLRAEALYLVGVAQEELGELVAAEATLRAALRASAEAGDDRLTARLWGRLIHVVGSSQARTEDGLAMREAAEIAITAAGEDPVSAAQVYNALGNLYAIAGEPAESRRYLERALAMREQALGVEHSEVATVLNNLGLTLLDLGEIEKARAAFERAVTIYEALQGADHPNTAMALDGLGLTYWAEGRLDEARARMEQALARRERALGDDHLEVARSRNNLGNVILEQGDHEAALPYLERAGARFEAIYGPDHPDVAGSHANLALVRLAQQRWDDALREGEAAVRGFEKALGPDHPVVAYGLVPIGSAYLGLGRAGDAVEPLRRAVALREGGAPHELAGARFELAKALDASKRDRPGAVAEARAARSLYAAQGDGRADEVAAIDAWLAERR